MSTSRKSMPRKSTAEKKLILKVDKWLEEPMTRDRLNQRTGTTDRIFEKPNRAEMCAEICDVSKSYIDKLRSGKIKIDTEKNPGGRPSIPIDDFDLRLLSRVTLGFYRRCPPELPTLSKIHELAINERFPACSISTIRRKLKYLGFCFKKRDTKMRVYQRMDVVAHRHKVLRRLQTLGEIEAAVLVESL